MNGLNIFVGVVDAGLGIFFVAISIPLLLGKIHINRIYGFRFPRAFQSEDEWQRINKYGARLMIRWSLLLIVIGIISFFIPANIQFLLYIFIILPPAFIPLIPFFQTSTYAQKS